MLTSASTGPPSPSCLGRYDDYQNGDFERYHAGNNRWLLTANGRAALTAARKAWEAEKQAVEDQIDTVRQGIEKLILTITEARNAMKPAVANLARLAANEAWDETANIEKNFKPQVHKEDRKTVQTQLDEDNSAITGLDTVADSGDLTGATLQTAVEEVDTVREMNSNRAKIATANKLIADYQDNYGDTLSKASDRLWNAGASSYTFSDNWSKFEDSIRDAAYDLSNLQGEHMPSNRSAYQDASDGGAYLRAVKSAIAKIDQKIHNHIKAIEPRAAAAEKLEELVSDLKRVHEQEETACYDALPAMKEALVHKKIAEDLQKRLTKAEADLKSWNESASISGSSESYAAQIKEIDDLPAKIRAKVEPKWFSYSYDLDELKKHIASNLMGEDGFTMEELAQADTQVKMATLLNKYDNWFELIKGARSAIMDDTDAARQAKSLKYLNEFETQVDKDLKAELGNMIDADKMQNIWDKLDSVKNDVELLTGAPGAKDAMEDFEMKYLPKLANDIAWKAIIKEDGWRKHLGTFHGGVNKATKGVGLLINVKKVISAGDTVSLVDGSSHPAIDGLSACLDAINAFNKVPVLNVLIDFYVVALGAISKGLAKISKQMAQKRLQFARLDGILTGPVMR